MTEEDILILSPWLEKLGKRNDLSHRIILTIRLLEITQVKVTDTTRGNNSSISLLLIANYFYLYNY